MWDTSVTEEHHSFPEQLAVVFLHQSQSQLKSYLGLPSFFLAFLCGGGLLGYAAFT
jgi:hypothetical protein